MNKLIVAAVASLLCMSGMMLSVQAEDKVELKKNDDDSWKMTIKRKNDKEWEGTHEGKTYGLRGDTAFATVKDEGDYTVYGTMAPDNTYITATRVERIRSPERTVRDNRSIDNTRPSEPRENRETDNTRPLEQRN